MTMPAAFSMALMCIALCGSIGAQASSEDLRKEQALLDVKRKLLDQEIERFQKERRDWEARSQAEFLLKNTVGLSETDLDKEARKTNIINKAVSEGFAGFLEENDRGGKTCAVIVVRISVDPDGEVTAAEIESSNAPKELGEKALKIAKKLDISGLNGDFGPITHRFPLVIRK